MIIQNIMITEPLWNVHILYDVRQDEVTSALMFMESKGMTGKYLEEASLMLNENVLNSGITYSNYENRMSIMVIGHTLEAKEFADTLDHEKGHLLMHLADYYSIDVKSEEFQYLSGHILRAMFPYASMFLCDRCNRYK